MSGIILILVALLWVVIAFVVVWLIGKLLPKIWWVFLLRVALFFALLPLPIVDELLGAKQFEQLCKENSTIQIDRTTAAGKTVYYVDQPSIRLEGTWVPIRLKRWRFIEVKTGETILSYSTLEASAGLLGPASLRPLTFEGYCAPTNPPASVESFRQFGINYVERPTEKSEK